MFMNDLESNLSFECLEANKIVTSKVLAVNL